MRLAARFEIRRILQDSIITYPRVGLVHLAIHQLEIHINEIATVDYGAEGFRFGIPRSFDGGMNLSEQAVEQFCGKLPLQKRLSARQRDPAARFAVDVGLPEQFFGKRPALPLHARNADEVLRADMQTPPQSLTIGMVAGSLAKPAVQASFLFEVEFPFR